MTHEKELLDFAIKNGMIDLDDVQNQMTKKEKQEILNNHPYNIWEGSDKRWKTYIPDETKKNGRKLLVKTHLHDLEDFLFSFYKNQQEETKLKEITLQELYPKWIEYKRLHTNAETYIMRINTDWNTYYKDSAIINIPVKELTKLDLDTWAHTLIQQYTMTKNQYYNVTVIMRQALLYAVDLGIIETSPFSLVKIDGKRLFRRVKKKPDYTQVFFKNELELISKMAFKDFYDRVKVYELAPLALLFQFQSGLRLGELCALRYEDIETPDYIHIQRMLRRDTKEVVEHTKTEYGERQVFLTPKAKKLIALAKEHQKNLGVDTNGYIFSITSYPLTERSVADLYVKYCRKAGIIQKSSHKSRKTFISALIDGQVSINTVREMVGHSDERTTLSNYTFDIRTREEKQDRIQKALDYF